MDPVLTSNPASAGTDVRNKGESQDAVVVSGNTATLALSDTSLVCVEYPAVVNNVDTMLESIGGEEGVSKTYGDSSKRLELRFRPKDPFSHPAYGNRYSSTNLLLRVRRRTRKGNSAETQISMEIVGLIGTTYKFQGMADFQYLASHNDPDGNQMSLYDKIILRKPEKKDFYDSPVPLFLPPPIFSRLDTPVDYYYRPDVLHSRETAMQSVLLKDHIIAPNRARRPNNAIFVNFDDKTIPSEPLEAAVMSWKKVCVHPNDVKAEQQLRQLFEKRPIWSRNAVKANINIHPEKMKHLLPYVAYYMLTGPWRSLWVRFGYDPRKTAEAKIYQVLDFRIRYGMKHGFGVNDMPVKPKRSAYHYSHPTTINRAVPQPASVSDITQESPSSSGPKPATAKYLLKDSVYIFREGMLPPYRQMFYQLCDLDVEKIKNIIHKNDGKEEVCDERDGWCVPHTADELRNIISGMIQQHVRVNRPASSTQKPLGTVSTEGGTVQGRNLLIGYFRYMDVFKGIPFAAPPDILQKPVPHPGWDGVLKTTEYGNECMQLNSFSTDVEGSENCLFLNIWVPHGSTVSTNLPVMVYIYGGGFLLGSSQSTGFLVNHLYDGQEIADRGNVIVVTFNYRVGTLGFLSSGDADAPGNYGLWDQHAAIAWVHRNIRNFGGNPDNITIFGESAGGVSVGLQILSPKNKGLVRRAISQSGAALCPWAINRNPRQHAEEIARKVGCPTDSGMVACLRMTNARSLTLAGTVDLFTSASEPIIQNLYLFPVIDGDFLPGEPDTLFGNAADIDYLAGVNDMDGHIFATLDVPSVNIPLLPTTVEEIRALSMAFSESRGVDAGIATFEQYTFSWGSNPSETDIKKTAVDLETDYIFLVPTQTALYLHSDHAVSGRTYSYLFSEPSRIPVYPLWMGADHADDLQYVFGKPFSVPLSYLPRHRDVSDYMISYWTNFAQTGDPNNGESRVPVIWPEFASSGHQYLEINSKMNSDSVKKMLKTRMVYYWTTVFASYPVVKKN
ncbi:bile salt-activated lipase-like protein [Labeo rohita]|uniref:Bile salt-activated lipase n=1 Tax=Labeo rohita TaxID=84645 RepID=A0A498M1F4_LABRO|nr:bile salt-activated lipase-like protein [Labeo rohita]